MRERELPTVHDYHLFGCLAFCGLSAVLLALAILIAAWTTRKDWSAASHPAGSPDPGRGRELLVSYGCPACHAIPGTAPPGLVGPPLTNMGRRSYIAGRIRNDENWMTRWLQDPQRWKPGTMMPNLEVGERDARDMAAYLERLR